MAKKNKIKNRLPEVFSSQVKDFYPKNQKQQDFIELIEEKEIIIATGVPGSGKTYVSLAAALNLLGEVYKKVVLVKSVTTLPGEELGFLKGSMLDKMEPHVFSYKWNVDKMCSKGAFDSMMNKGIIEILPLAFIRGITIDDAIVIIDEAQNLNAHLFKSIMTRIGENSKYIFLGDTEQVDLRRKDKSFLKPISEIFQGEDYIGSIEFTDEDCVRNPLIPKILEKLKEHNV